VVFSLHCLTPSWQASPTKITQAAAATCNCFRPCCCYMHWLYINSNEERRQDQSLCSYGIVRSTASRPAIENSSYVNPLQLTKRSNLQASRSIDSTADRHTVMRVENVRTYQEAGEVIYWVRRLGKVSTRTAPWNQRVRLSVPLQ